MIQGSTQFGIIGVSQLEVARQQEASLALKSLSLPTKTVGVNEVAKQEANLANFALEAGAVKGIEFPTAQVNVKTEPTIQQLDLSQSENVENMFFEENQNNGIIGVPPLHVDTPEVKVESQNLEKLELPTQPQSLPADEEEIAKKEEKIKKLKKWSWITAGILVVLIALIVIVKVVKKKK